MTRAKIIGGGFAIGVLLLVALAAVHLSLQRDGRPAPAASPAVPPTAPPVGEEADPAAAAYPGFLYGRILTVEGATYEGRLRWGKGGGQEASWGDYFNGDKIENPWAAHVPPERLIERYAIRIFGVKIAQEERPADLHRFFMARFGDIARIEARGNQVRVTLKSGTVFDLNRFGASDFDDGVRVWDGKRGVVDLDSLRIRAIELLPATGSGPTPGRLHGTVRTRQGEEFTGFVQWDREECVGSDEIEGNAADGKLSLRFDTIRSIARRSPDSSRVTLLDGREIVLSGTSDVGRSSRGIYVDDRRYGRVLVTWYAFDRADFGVDVRAGDSPSYGDFPPGRPLKGSVTTRAGRRVAGRIVYDLDESETTETLDAPFQGVDYTIPFSLVASIVPPGREEHARVTLRNGEELRLDDSGDLGARNAGLLIFAGGRQRPEYVPWTDVQRIDLDRQ
jgi:hypothetical protein